MGKRKEWCPDRPSSSVTKWDHIESGCAGLGQDDMRGNQRGEDTQYGYLKLLLRGASINQDIQKGLVVLQASLMCTLGGLKDTNTRYYESQANKDSSY